MATNKRQFVRVQGARGRAQYEKQLQQIAKDNVCPFCDKHFSRYHKPPILRRSANWLVTTNMNTYQGAKHHFLLIHKKHIESPERMTPAAAKELLGHLKWVEKKTGIRGGTLFMRFGDTRYTGASVAHVHAHILSGTASDVNTEPIAVVLGHKRKSTRA